MKLVAENGETLEVGWCPGAEVIGNGGVWCIVELDDRQEITGFVRRNSGQLFYLREGDASSPPIEIDLGGEEVVASVDQWWIDALEEGGPQEANRVSELRNEA